MSSRADIKRGNELKFMKNSKELKNKRNFKKEASSSSTENKLYDNIETNNEIGIFERVVDIVNESKGSTSSQDSRETETPVIYNQSMTRNDETDSHDGMEVIPEDEEVQHTIQQHFSPNGDQQENFVTLDQLCCSGRALRCICNVTFKLLIIILLFGILILLAIRQN